MRPMGQNPVPWGQEGVEINPRTWCTPRWKRRRKRKGKILK